MTQQLPDVPASLPELAADDVTVLPAGTRTGPGTVLDVVLAEAVQAGRTLPVTDGLTWTIWRTSGELHLLDLTSRWSQRTRTGTQMPTAPHERTQPWARAIRTRYPQLHGILTTPATGGRALATALNETSTTHLAGPIELSRQLRHPQLLPIIGHTAQHLSITLDLI